MPTQRDSLNKMIESNASYRDYAAAGHNPAGEDRMAPSLALLVTLGLSLLGWAIVLAPLVAIFSR
jgi:hypothetical protein